MTNVSTHVRNARHDRTDPLSILELRRLGSLQRCTSSSTLVGMLQHVSFRASSTRSIRSRLVTPREHSSQSSARLAFSSRKDSPQTSARLAAAASAGSSTETASREGSNETGLTISRRTASSVGGEVDDSLALVLLYRRRQRRRSRC